MEEPVYKKDITNLVHSHFSDLKIDEPTVLSFVNNLWNQINRSGKAVKPYAVSCYCMHGVDCLEVLDNLDLAYSTLYQYQEEHLEALTKHWTHFQLDCMDEEWFVNDFGERIDEQKPSNHWFSSVGAYFSHSRIMHYVPFASASSEPSFGEIGPLFKIFINLRARFMHDLNQLFAKEQPRLESELSKYEQICQNSKDSRYKHRKKALTSVLMLPLSGLAYAGSQAAKMLENKGYLDSSAQYSESLQQHGNDMGSEANYYADKLYQDESCLVKYSGRVARHTEELKKIKATLDVMGKKNLCPTLVSIDQANVNDVPPQNELLPVMALPKTEPVNDCRSLVDITQPAEAIIRQLIEKLTGQENNFVEGAFDHYQDPMTVIDLLDEIQVQLLKRGGIKTLELRELWDGFSQRCQEKPWFEKNITRIFKNVEVSSGLMGVVSTTLGAWQDGFFGKEPSAKKYPGEADPLCAIFTNLKACYLCGLYEFVERLSVDQGMLVSPKVAAIQSHFTKMGYVQPLSEDEFVIVPN